MDARKILLVIFDGLGDRPLTELGHKTPLEATPKPNLDWFASNGVNGLVDPIAPGVAAGSDTSHLALFGYDPKEVYTGRGPFEAAGVGIDMKPGDIAFRGNFASVDEDLKRSEEHTSELQSRLHLVCRLLLEKKKSSVDRKSTRLNSSHGYISYAVFCLKKKNKYKEICRDDIMRLHLYADHHEQPHTLQSHII